MKQTILILFLFATPFHLFAQIVEYHPEVDSLQSSTSAQPYYKWDVTNHEETDSLSIQVFHSENDVDYSIFTSPQIEGEFENFSVLINNNEDNLDYIVQYSIGSPENSYSDIQSDSFHLINIETSSFIFLKIIVLEGAEEIESLNLVVEHQIGTSIEENDMPLLFSLSQNYPNPFNPVTVINFQLPVHSEVRLEVFDMLGRRVALLANGVMEAGTHEVTFDASNLASGVYLYRLTTGQVVQTRQMVLVK